MKKFGVRQFSEEQTLKVFCMVTTTKGVAAVKVQPRLEATDCELAITGSITDLLITASAFELLGVAAIVTVGFRFELVADNRCSSFVASSDIGWRGC